MPPEATKEVTIDLMLLDEPKTPAAIKANVAALQRSFTSGQATEVYDVQTALQDLPIIRTALQLFLQSKMVESEDLINSRDPVKCASIAFEQPLHRLTCYIEKDSTVQLDMVSFRLLRG
jgi:hypothetical protein